MGELRLTDLFKVLPRELFSGVALGYILGVIGFLRSSIWSAFSNLYGPHRLAVATIVALALVGVVLWGSLELMLPFVLSVLIRRCLHPSVPTLVDVTGLVIYFCVGFIVVRGMVME